MEILKMKNSVSKMNLFDQQQNGHRENVDKKRISNVIADVNINQLDLINIKNFYVIFKSTWNIGQKKSQ